MNISGTLYNVIKISQSDLWKWKIVSDDMRSTHADCRFNQTCFSRVYPSNRSVNLEDFIVLCFCI